MYYIFNFQKELIKYYEETNTIRQENQYNQIPNENQFSPQKYKNYSPNKAEKKLIKLKERIPNLQSKINDEFIKDFQYYQHNRNLINQFKYVVIDDLLESKNPNESLKELRIKTEKKRVGLYEECFKQVY